MYNMRNLDNTRVHSRDGLANMVNILAKQRNSSRICHINAQKIEFICISETWLDASISDASISLDGYNVCRNVRNGYGGVAIYIKKSIQFKVIGKSGVPDNPINTHLDGVIDKENQVEYIFIGVSSEERHLLLCCVYRPSRNIRMDYFFRKLELLLVRYDDVVIAGDFNSNIFVERNFLDVMKSLGLRSPNLNMPTHLDMFFVNRLSKILMYDQLSASCFSKHDLIFMTYNFQLHIVPDKHVTFRNCKNIHFNLLEYEFQQIYWDHLFYMHSEDEQIMFLESNINNQYDLSVPLKTIAISRKKNPWFSNNIKQASLSRDLAYDRWKRFKTTYLIEQYRKLRNELNNIYLWDTSNGLSINPNKSKCLVIGKPVHTSYASSNVNIIINNQPIEIVNSAKNLGIIFNSNLSWSDHINYICGRTFSMIRSLWHSQHCTPLNIRILFAKTYLIPILLYGCELFASCDANFLLNSMEQAWITY
ncbi:hypothetical protein CVS40_8304 [Lucilia cuprina]|nr:hypothetical protein CVS40_8304 [Lucilia cuprina]